MNEKPRILYAIIDGQVTGGNVVCLHFIDEALRRGWEASVASPSDGPFCDVVRGRRVPVYHLDTSRSFRWDSAFKMARLIRKLRVCLVHAHAPFAGTILARLGGGFAGVPVITHAHVRDPLNPHPLIRAYQVALNRWTSRACCSAVIAVSEQVKREFIEQGTDPRKVRVVYNGITVDARQGSDPRIVRKQLGIPEEALVIAHIGRLCETKGQHLLIKAASIIRRSRQDAIILLIGEDLAGGGSYRRKLEGLAKELKVDDVVRFLGQRQDVPRLLAAADMLVLPSSAEGLPIVILEAMAAGKPVVTTPVGGVPEIVSHGETGVLVPVGDVHALADAILYLIQNPDTAHAMGREGLKRVRTSFSLDGMVQKTFQIYEEVLGSSSFLVLRVLPGRDRTRERG